MVAALDVLGYAAANARVRGLYSRLLSARDWQELLATESLAITINVLKRTNYGAVIEEAENSGIVSLEGLERRLTGHAALNCRRAMSFLSGQTRNLLQVWWRQYELENLKAVFRGLDQNMDPALIARYLIPLGSYSTLPFDTLVQEHAVAGLIDQLSQTHYINPLRAAYPLYEREHSLFPIEVALDIRYYRDLAAAMAHLKSNERAEARRVIGTQLDILNILWAFRYRVYYHLSAEEIVNYTLWHTVRTDTNLVRSIALGADPRDIVTFVWGRDAVDLSLLQDYASDTQMMPRLELTLERFWRKVALRELSGYPFNLAVLLAYLVLEQLEVRDLVTLLESKGMRWDAERIRQHLVRGKE